ncbi:hypothetical protein OG244_01580 [Streptomyces brevispora]|uniref:hypothetical protein n=1 Tax=Streptomyces brevispora TaxID=887462 RepID=UPI002E34F77E|nr:hypothetical protein [Streptomyces brevispora]
MSPLEVGTAMAVLTSCGHADADDSAPDSEGVVRRVQNLPGVDPVTAPSGILPQDIAADAVIAPGCCFGLANRRDWLGLMAGEEVWLSHDTATHIEHLESLVRLWPDTAPPARAPSSSPWPNCLTSSNPCTTGSTDSWTSPDNGLPVTHPLRLPP